MTPPTAPDATRETVIRCREPFTIGARFDALPARSSPVASATRAEDDEGDEGESEDGDTGGRIALVGIASSTSVDAHGTEMSVAALTRMAEQMRAGIPLLPRHNRGFDVIEWDEVIGRTMDAEVERADVADGAGSEAGHILRLTSLLYSDDPMADRLVRRLDRGEEIGQSIGGWFLSVRIVEDREGNVERVIIEDVELDHVAVTRAPSNPDSIGLASIRSRSLAIRDERVEIESRSVAPAAPAESPAPAARANPEAVAVGDFVRFLDSTVDAETEEDGGERVGEIVEVVSEGSVAGSDVEPSEADPVLRIDVYVAVGDGYEASGEIVAYPASAVSKIDPLDPPSSAETEEEVEAEVAASAGDSPDARAVPEFVDLPAADPETEWSWSADVADEILGDPPDWSRFASVHLYVDDDRAEERAGYLLPVAKQIDGEIRVVLAGLRLAVDALNDPDGGAGLDGDDRRAAYDRAAEFYSLFDEEIEPLLDLESDDDEEDDGDDRSSPISVDVPDDLVHDSVVREAPLARSVSPAPSPPSPEETSMTPTDLDAIRAMIREEVARGAAPSVEAPAAPPTVTPAATPEDDDSVALRSEIERLRSTVDRLASEPIRRGLAYQPTNTTGGHDAGAPMDALVMRARADAPALAAVVERTLPRLDEKGVSPSALTSSLAAVLRAAENEGVLGNPAPARWA